MKRFYPLQVLAIGVLAVLFGNSSSIRAEDAAPLNTSGWYITPKLGISGFTGIIGLEMQNRHIALDVGYPLSGGVRYYVHPDTHSWFAGVFGQGASYSHDETKDGIDYTHFSRIQGGIGSGYRWLWRQRWSLELGMTVGIGHDRWTNDQEERTDSMIYFGPVAAAGISF